MKRFTLHFLLITMLVSCLQAPTNSRSDSADFEGSSENTGNVDGAIPGDIGEILNLDDSFAAVEIRHLIEPKLDDESDGGTYDRKLTIPKNYSGFLYLAGLNVSTLSSKNVKVRFRFGRTRAPIDVQATVSLAPGIASNVRTQVLVLDLAARPFEDLTLNYELYDYKQYDFTAGEEPTQFNRDSYLYCRGLTLEDDPTVEGSSCDASSAADASCLYSYAKVIDQGLIRDIDNVPVIPSDVAVQSGDNGYNNDTDEDILKRCLPDSYTGYNVNAGINFPFSGNVDFERVDLIGLDGTETVNGESYRFEGPYLAIDSLNWDLTASAHFGPYGIFGTGSSIGAMGVTFGYNSNLFPKYTKLELGAGVQYRGIASLTNPEISIVHTMPTNGETFWMDGCNKRASTVHEVTGEHIGSCNVTAMIEVLQVNSDGTEQVITTSNEVKLQLVKSKIINSDNEDVLSSNFQSCSSSSQCGADSCCYNKRCWSKSIVSQCLEEADIVGNGVTGDSCQSDFECSSLCCNQTTQKCAVHDTGQNPPVLCSKPTGQQCLSSEYCAEHTVTRCYIVNTGTDALGNTTCDRRCYHYQVNGDCRASGSSNAVCVPPAPFIQPNWNPNDPNRCDGAIDPAEVPTP